MDLSEVWKGIFTFYTNHKTHISEEELKENREIKQD